MMIPAGIATYSIAGAQFGTSLLWTALLTWPLMASVQMMCARIGMVTGSGLTVALSKKFPRPVVLLAIVALLGANTINVAADLSGMADAARMLIGFRSYVWVLLFAVGISIATVKLRYRQIASTLKWLCLALFAYVATAFIVKVDWHEALRNTFVPSIPAGKGAWEMVVAILGTTISPYLFFWQAAEEVEGEKASGRRTVEERKGASAEEIQMRRFDVGTGTFFSNVIMYFIILTTAFTLHRAGATHIETSKQVAEALRPLAGRFAALLYTVGIIGVGLLAIPTLTGSTAYAFADALAWRQGLDKRLFQARAFYAVILLSTALAVVMDFARVNPVKALYWTAVINGLLAPFLLVGVLLVARDAAVMSGQESGKVALFVVGATALVMFAAAVAMFVL